MSAANKIKKIISFLFLGMVVLYAIGVGLQLIGQMMAGDDELDLKRAAGHGDNWYGYILLTPAEINEENADIVYIQLHEGDVIGDIGPLFEMEECTDAAASFMNSLFDPEGSSYICGLNCESTGMDYEFACDEIVQEKYSSGYDDGDDGDAEDDYGEDE